MNGIFGSMIEAEMAAEANGLSGVLMFGGALMTAGIIGLLATLNHVHRSTSRFIDADDLKCADKQSKPDRHDCAVDLCRYFRVRRALRPGEFTGDSIGTTVACVVVTVAGIFIALYAIVGG